jgi:cell division protein FtsI (penicillin-binding protein 3)
VKANLIASYIAWRFYVVISIILLIVAGLVVRLVDLTVINQHFLRNQSNARIIRTVSTPAFRGMIADRNGFPLAVSTAVYSVWVDPLDFSFTNESLKPLSQLLEMKVSALQTIIRKGDEKGREFVYLKRGVSPKIAREVKALKIPGISLQEDFKRFYPEGEVAAHIVGFTNIDDHGEEGLELVFNKWLAGDSGKKVVIKDRLGREVSEIRNLQTQKPGSDLKLSIDKRIQYLAYRELMTGIQKNMADSGSAVVLDVKSGEVLAMVNYPSYNPNNRVNQKAENFRNRAVTDTFEPGSTIKTFTVAAALRSGRYKPDTLIDTSPGWWSVGGHLVRDEHNKGVMTVTQILQVSSDVGVSKIILTLPPYELWNMLRAVGFAEATGVGLPGERSGSLIDKDKLKPFPLATLSFGYGISVTPLQLAHAYATLANGGIKIPISILKVDKQPQGERVLDKSLADQMLVVLKSVVAKGGTADSIGIPGYQLAGKTGTALIVGPHGYERHRYHSSFVGIAPASRPRIVIAVVIHNPKNKLDYLNNGGFVSAPVFEKIAEGSLRTLNVPPDDLASLAGNANAAKNIEN